MSVTTGNDGSAHPLPPTITVHHGDALEVLRGMASDGVDAVVTDPPYLLGFMGKAWDTRPAHEHLAWHEAWAAECLRVLKPGGHLLAFGGTRTWHRMACAIEDAGFELRDTITWLYGSGFPKSLDVGKAIDKAAGATREVVGLRSYGDGQTYAGGAAAGRTGSGIMGTPAARPASLETAPATPEAQQWHGWGTALKPASEPVVCARKPFSPVPLDWRLVAHVHHALAGLLWLSLSPAKRAALTSTSSAVEPHEGWCASARVAAAMDTSHGASEATVTFSSPALASTSLSIAGSWSSILAALSDPTTTSTTATASSTTTALRTCYSLLAPITSPTTMPACDCLTGGPSWSASSAASASTDEWTSWLATLSASVPATATEGLALAAASALAQVAARLSAGQAEASSAPPPATTRAAASPDTASEPIVVARKPLAGTVAANVLAHGTGALNIDGCRVGTTGSRTNASAPRAERVSMVKGMTTGTASVVRDAGRWPANVVLDGDAADALDEQSGTSTSTPVSFVNAARNVMDAAGRSGPLAPNPGAGYTDTGGASRFFPVFRYQAKAPARERPSYYRPDCDCEAGQWQDTSPARGTADSASVDDRSWNTSASGNTSTGAECPPGTTSTTGTATSSTTTPTTSSASPSSNTSASTPVANYATGSGGNPAATAASSSPSTLDIGTSAPRDGHSTGGAAPATFEPSSTPRDCAACGRPWRRESHATVKPLDLLRWMVRLVTPPGGIVLDPFAGSGTTGEAALLEGFDAVLIEREATYLPLIDARIARTATPDGPTVGRKTTHPSGGNTPMSKMTDERLLTSAKRARIGLERIDKRVAKAQTTIAELDDTRAKAQAVIDGADGEREEFNAQLVYLGTIAKGRGLDLDAELASAPAETAAEEEDAPAATASVQPVAGVPAFSQ